MSQETYKPFTLRINGSNWFFDSRTSARLINRAFIDMKRKNELAKPAQAIFDKPKHWRHLPPSNVRPIIVKVNYFEGGMATDRNDNSN